jgi:murein DD-endopeptidase MepM/ murein hydrolase activator NlpD
VRRCDTIDRIDHGDGPIQRGGGRASRLNVKAGDLVVREQRAVTVGTTGRSTEPHQPFQAGAAACCRAGHVPASERLTVRKRVAGERGEAFLTPCFLRVRAKASTVAVRGPAAFSPLTR